MLSDCKLCGKQKKLIKAHIIPGSFYKYSKDNSDYLMLISDNDYPKKSRIGVYDNNILCKECDGNIIGIFDNYAKNLLFDQNYTIMKYSNIKYFKIENFEYDKLMMFFLSMVWRASISKHDFFASVNLGPQYESTIKEIIRTGDLNTNIFSCLLLKYHGHLANFFEAPSRERYNGVNYYRFKFVDYLLIIKVDQRPVLKNFKSLIIQPNRPIYIRYTEFTKSTSFKRLINFAKNNQYFKKLENQ